MQLVRHKRTRGTSGNFLYNTVHNIYNVYSTIVHTTNIFEFPEAGEADPFSLFGLMGSTLFDSHVIECQQIELVLCSLFV